MRPFLVRLALGLGALGILFPSRIVHGDAYDELASYELARPVFEYRHPIAEPLLWALTHAARALHLAERSLRPTQWWNAVWVIVALGLVFVAGGGVFCVLDYWLGRRGGTHAQVMAMMLDFVPEAIAMGAVFAHDARLGLLLALFIGAQNLPEGFNAFRESRKAGSAPRVALGSLLAVSLFGPVGALAGYTLLHDQLAVTAALMAFAAGGILYLVFQDIAPQARMRRHWTPTLGAVLGFVVGMVGKQVLG